MCHASHGGSGHEQQRSLRAGRHIIFLAPRLFSGFPRLFDFAGTRLMALHIGFEPCGELLANPHLLIDGPARAPLLDLPCLALRPLLVQRGIETFEQARSFFRPSLQDLGDPFLMKDMDIADERLHKAVSTGC